MRTLRFSRIWLAILLLCVFVAPALAADARGRSVRIINGVEVRSQNSPVVAVRARIGVALGLCSGTVIAPRVVLTAAHCLVPSARFTVANGRRKVRVRRAVAHPDFTLGADSGLAHYDAALLFLAQRIRPRLALLTSRPAQPGELLTVAGYGLDEQGRIGTLRSGVIPVLQVTTDYLITIFTSADTSDPCNGDSGGPAILSYQDAAGRKHTGVAGIISAGRN